MAAFAFNNANLKTKYNLHNPLPFYLQMMISRYFQWINYVWLIRFFFFFKVSCARMTLTNAIRILVTLATVAMILERSSAFAIWATLVWLIDVFVISWMRKYKWNESRTEVTNLQVIDWIVLWQVPLVAIASIIVRHRHAGIGEYARITWQITLVIAGLVIMELIAKLI